MFIIVIKKILGQLILISRAAICAVGMSKPAANIFITGCGNRSSTNAIQPLNINAILSKLLGTEKEDEREEMVFDSIEAFEEMRNKLMGRR